MNAGSPTPRIVKQLIHILVEKNILNQDQQLELQGKEIHVQKELEAELCSVYGVSSEDILLALAEFAGIPIVSLAQFTAVEDLLQVLPETLLMVEKVFPLAVTDKTMTLALADPFNVIAIQKVSDLTRKKVLPVAALAKEIDDLLKNTNLGTQRGLDDILKDAGDSNIELEERHDDHVDISEALEDAEGVPVIRIVNMILMDALRRNASDIHIEPFEKELRLRYRVDGVLFEGSCPPKALQSAISSRIKVMSQLDISERRIPQDGKFRIKAQGRDIDLRVSTLPTVHGEKIVMRILDKGNLRSGLDDLGLDEESLAKLKHAVNHPHGLILVTGPTGSGKTTTLYSCLQELNKPEVNIVTVANPVEYQMEGINQVEINDKAGMTFSAALRSILRQDPDIVLVGETRDSITADIAVKAALTGHLVLTTLHTNSAPGAITRLGDMGIEPFLLSSSIVLSQAQRLVRTICPHCKEKVGEIDRRVCKENKIPMEMFNGKTIFYGKGCSRCGGSGYRGRASIMEILVITPTIREMIVKGATSDRIGVVAVDEQGFKDLRMNGFLRVLEGVTTIEEVLRVTAGDD